MPCTLAPPRGTHNDEAHVVVTTPWRCEAFNRGPKHRERSVLVPLVQCSCIQQHRIDNVRGVVAVLQAREDASDFPLESCRRPPGSPAILRRCCSGLGAPGHAQCTAPILGTNPQARADHGGKPGRLLQPRARRQRQRHWLDDGHSQRMGCINQRAHLLDELGLGLGRHPLVRGAVEFAFEALRRQLPVRQAGRPEPDPSPARHARYFGDGPTTPS